MNPQIVSANEATLDVASLPSTTEVDGRNSDAFIPLQQYNNSAWDLPSANSDSHSELRAPMMYSDDVNTTPRVSTETRVTERKADYDMD